VIVVSNASPLIILGKLDGLSLLADLFVEVLITPEVYQEVVVDGAGRPAASAVQSAKWISVTPLLNPALMVPLKQRTLLGSGEISTVLLAGELHADLVIIDEQRGRQLAVSHGLKVMGCVGVLETGFRKGFVGDLRDTYLRLLASGAHLDRQILNQSLAGFKLQPI
jgi:predicted nucleic acid-binding protein